MSRPENQNTLKLQVLSADSTDILLLQTGRLQKGFWDNFNQGRRFGGEFLGWSEFLNVHKTSRSLRD